MDFQINYTPHLMISDITKMLFNRNFYSDVQFFIDDKIIYAHSRELMKRSVVFEERLENLMGDIKLIPVVNCKYEWFFEFIRFIYTDECDITEDNGIEILKLATQYKVIMLENKVINCVILNYSKGFLLKLFEHCIIDKYELIRNTVESQISQNLERCLKDQQLLLLHPDAVRAILQFDSIPAGVTEFQMFTAVGNWITSFSNKYNIPLCAGRQHYDELIREIRFPTMSNQKINECTKKFPGLLSKIDCKSIAEQTVFGAASDNENNVWISKRRREFIWPYEYGTFSRDNKYEIKLSVTNETILHGIRIGANAMVCEKSTEMEISRNDNDKISFILSGFMFWDLTINFGDVLLLKSNSEYKITIKYLNMANPFVQVLRRKVGFNAIINDPSKSVRVLQISRNVFEMFFKLPTN